MSVGLGLGYRLPEAEDIWLPNVTSVRLRLASGLTFEPIVALKRVKVVDDDGMVANEDVESGVDVAVGVRYPLVGRGRIDLSVTGLVGFLAVTQDPDGPDNARRSSLFAVDYGLGLDYWFAPHWGLSFSTSNGLLARTSVTQEHGTGMPDTTIATTGFGFIFSPRTTVMLHMYL